MSLVGVWKSRGYGWYLLIDSDNYAFYDYTSRACVEFERGTLKEFNDGFEFPHTQSEDHLALRVRNDLSRYDFDRVDSLPDHILPLEADRLKDPLQNFEHFCEIFRQDYAFFDLRGVDWNEVCKCASKDINSESTDDELFAALHGLILHLHDNHVVLSDGARRVVSEKPVDVKALIKSELELRSHSIGDPYNIKKLSDFIDREFLSGNAKRCGNNVVLWGMISPDVAYVNVLKLFGLADTERARTFSDLPPHRPDHAQFLSEDLDAIEHIMDKVMSEIGHAKAIILDVRINGGGFDCVGMAIANRFADKKRLAFTKQSRDGAGLTPVQEFYIQPSGDFQYTGPVYLLTSRRTASAGDIFAMCMRSLPHVTLVGEPSTGILSDNLTKHLSNGWTTSISNEWYRSADDRIFEGPGVPVDVSTPVYVKDDFKAGYHLAVEMALHLASDNQVKMKRR